MSRSATHEAARNDDEDVKMGSERGFAIVFAVVFTIIGLWPLWRAASPRWWSLGIAAAFLLAGFLAPAVLKPLNTLWFKLGMLLGKIMTPIVMGILFFVVVLPTGIIMRLRGHDLLRTRLDKEAKSYWIHRSPPGPPPESLKNQF